MVTVPPVAMMLPRVHSIAIYDPPSWRGLPLALNLAHLEDLDLQVKSSKDTKASRKIEYNP